MTPTTPTTTTTNSLAIRLLKHFAVTSVAAAACCAAGAEADVIRWTNANLVVPASIDGLYIDVQTRQTGSAGAQVPGWDLNPYGPNSLTWFNAAGTGMMRYPGIAEGSAGSLAPGMTIGPAGSFGSGAIVVGVAPGQWQLKGANYFGSRFRTQDGSTHYGWGKFEIGSAIDGSDRRITELAWGGDAGCSDRHRLGRTGLRRRRLWRRLRQLPVDREPRPGRHRCRWSGRRLRHR